MTCKSLRSSAIIYGFVYSINLTISIFFTVASFRTDCCLYGQVTQTLTDIHSNIDSFSTVTDCGNLILCSSGSQSKLCLDTVVYNLRWLCHRHIGQNVIRMTCSCNTYICWICSASACLEKRFKKHGCELITKMVRFFFNYLFKLSVSYNTKRRS